VRRYVEVRDSKTTHSSKSDLVCAAVCRRYVENNF
jgi:hypothetical protein